MYKVLNQAGGTEILLYSLIEGGYTATRVIEALREIDPSAPITLRINSDGGEVFDAIAIYNYIKDRDVTVMIDGICASAATIVAMAGKTVIMKTGSMFMIHRPLTLAWGNSEELKTVAEALDKLTESMVAIYQTKTNATKEELIAAMAKESWLTASEALEWGFVDVIDDIPEANSEQTSDSYSAGVQAERQRLKALDELYTPGRREIINRAKYQTGQTASDIAIEILKAEARNTQTVNGITLPVGHKEQSAIEDFTQTILRKRGN